MALIAIEVGNNIMQPSMAWNRKNNKRQQ